MDRPLLDEFRQWKGYWWPAGERDKAMPGTLSYRAEQGLELQLIGGWDDQVWAQPRPGLMVAQGTRGWPVVHGFAANSEVTLLDCHSTHTLSRNSGSPEEQTLNVMTALSGVHLDAASDPVFTACLVAVEDLTMWSDSSVLSSSRSFKDGLPTGDASIVAKPVKNPSVTVRQVVTSLVHEHTLPHFEYKREGTVGRMRETRFMRFQPPEPWTLTTAQEHVKMVQDLLSLALHRPCGVLWVQLKMPPGERHRPKDYPVNERTVDLYAGQIVDAAPSAKALHPTEALFTCEHLPFEQIWPRWCEVRERCLPASNMILGLRYAPARFIEGQLLTATGSAEVLHRALGRAKPPIPADEFAALRHMLLERVPDQHREWVRSKLRNDVTLKERLHDLARLPDSEAVKRLVPDVERWATVTTQARNDLTHEGHTRRQSLDEAVAAVKVTSAIVVLNLLEALGVPSERQREVINDHAELRLTAQQARGVLTAGAVDGEAANP